jgi:putative hydrolase of the HAD superfamily
VAIRGVLFDVGGVLHRYVGDPVARDIMEYFGITEAEMAPVWMELVPLLGTGQIDEAEFWRRFQQAVGTDLALSSTSLLVRRFGDEFVVFEDVLSWARGLRTRGLRVGILSDTVEVQSEWVRRRGLHEGFDAVALSHETGWRKPSPESFRLALDRLGTLAEETIFIDDAPGNVAGACAVGLQGILFTGFTETRDRVEALLREPR